VWLQWPGMPRDTPCTAHSRSPASSAPTQGYTNLPAGGPGQGWPSPGTLSPPRTAGRPRSGTRLQLFAKGWVQRQGTTGAPHSSLQARAPSPPRSSPGLRGRAAGNGPREPLGAQGPHRARPRKATQAHNGAPPVLTQNLPAPVGVGLVGVDPLEVLSRHAAPHGGGARPGSGFCSAPSCSQAEATADPGLVSVCGGSGGEEGGRGGARSSAPFWPRPTGERLGSGRGSGRGRGGARGACPRGPTQGGDPRLWERVLRLCGSWDTGRSRLPPAAGARCPQGAQAQEKVKRKTRLRGGTSGIQDPQVTAEAPAHGILDISIGGGAQVFV
jgi:hypothetical protein